MQYNFSNFKNELRKVEEFLGKEYNQLNIGRASPMVLDGVSVESYGSFVPLKNVASVSIEDPKTLRIAPWDKSQIKNIEKAIAGANLGLSAATDDLGIRVIFPQLTTETRQTLVKVLKEKLEETRISLRKARDEVWKEIQDKERKKEISEDEKFRLKGQMEERVKKGGEKLEELSRKKEREIME